VPFAHTIGDNRGEAGLPGQDVRRSGPEGVGGPSLDLVLKAIDISEGIAVGGEKVTSIEEYWEGETLGDEGAEEGCEVSPGGGKALDEGEGRLG